MDQQARSDRWIPRYFVFFFLGLTAVYATLGTIAVRTHPGTISDHPYEIGLHYNDVIAAADGQAALGWKGALAFMPGKEARSGIVSFSLADKQGKAIAPDAVKIELLRPAFKGHDFAGEMKREGAAFVFPVTLPMQGQWELRAYATVGDKKYQQTQRIVVP